MESFEDYSTQAITMNIEGWRLSSRVGLPSRV